MAASPKDTIYIDIDDEITGIIDKLGASNGRVVALVLPKRAAVLQSIVNMRLLKRAADETKKNVVLITSEAGLLPLAGVVGLHVAKTLSSKPEVPVAPSTDDSEETVDEESGESAASSIPEVTTATAGALAVGDLAGLPPNDDVETVEMDNDEPGTDDSSEVDTKTKDVSSRTAKKDKKLHVPNFERFRLLLILAGLVLILLIVGLVFALKVLPKAVINITTDASNVNASLNLNLSTTAKTLDPTSNTVPAKAVQQVKTYTQQATATGQKNEGTKASGQVVLYNCDKNDRLFAQNQSIPAGTGISSGGKTYITQEKANVPPSSFKPDGTCRQDAPSGNVDVIAQTGGTSYNTSGNTNFTVAYANPGDGTNSFSGASSGGIGGGTDNNVQVVAQADIDSAKAKITTTDPTVKQALQNQLTQDNYYAIASTFSAGTPTATNSANVGDAASSVTVTEVVTYTMFGVHESDLKTLVDNSVKTQIDTQKQSILSEGLAAATFSVNNTSATGAQLTMQSVAVAGPQLDATTIKQQAAGKKSGDVKGQLETNPDVTGVTIKLSPFWVTSVPGKTSKITVNIAKPTTKASSANANNP